MMKINLDIDGKYDDIEVIIRAPHLNNDIERMVAMSFFLPYVIQSILL